MSSKTQQIAQGVIVLTFNSSGLRFKYDNRRSYIFKSDKPQKDASVEVSQEFSHCSACEKNVCGYSDNRMVQLLCRAELNLLNSKIPASPLQGLNHQPWDSKLSKPLLKPFSWRTYPSLNYCSKDLSVRSWQVLPVNAAHRFPPISSKTMLGSENRLVIGKAVY